MNKIEKALFDHAKSLLSEYLNDEIEAYKKKLDEKNESLLFDVFNTGILIDVDKLKSHGLNHLQKQLKIRAKKGTKKKDLREETE